MKFVSIIIPTYNDWTRLELCLLALDKQTYPKQFFEIIVVNNNPNDTVPADLFIPTNCQILVEKKTGSYAARNAGLAICKGEIIGFTDSDCIPYPYWIQNAVSFLNDNPKYTRIAGKIELFYKSNQLSDAELYEKVYAFKQDFAASVGCSVTGNMFTYKDVIDQVGNFNEKLFSGGDSEWSLRAERMHYKIAYGDNVTIQHPARYEMAELTKKAKRTAGFYGTDKKKALIRFVKYCIPPVNAFVHSKTLTFKEKIKVFRIRYQLNLIKSSEELRIAFGKIPNRS